MFITHLPKLHSHFFIFYSTPRIIITSALLSKSKTTPVSHFSSATAAANTLLQTPELLQAKNLEIEDVLEKPHVEISVEKLFFPPDTDVSSGSRPLSSRILKGSNIVLSKYAGNSQVEQAEFVKSSVDTEACPSDGLPEFALVGRSNVGKSSLLNSLVRRKKLALTSKKPGKTQCINHFRINDSWHLVDLPGYGYAAAPHEVRTDWAKFTKDYFINRPTLVSVFLLIDASIPAKKIDLDYASWLAENKIPMTIVFTKCDKRKKKKTGGKKPEENLQDFLELIQKFFQTAPPWIMTSSVTNQGRDEILLHMSQLRNYWLKH
ncbi:P-loop containing nucleoside triphosphate hydrolases superfamily protein [Solanum lycopersicum]|uniref:EngB-type G domain-containing protein n=1 Tax=Solanum lycopersicum TaxID=4081 RepID=A0A3Q7HPR0_SOLLC|nr:P-loop containing nucleoside triphosphate hydrolases superfamily protein [Solanum lycopersicum]